MKERRKVIKERRKKKEGDKGRTDGRKEGRRKF